MFASEYRWSREQILDGIYLDEYFFMVEKIKARKKSDLLMQSHLHLLSSMDDDTRKEFIDSLIDKKPIHMEGKTDFAALEKAKQFLINGGR